MAVFLFGEDEQGQPRHRRCFVGWGGRNSPEGCETRRSGVSHCPDILRFALSI